MREFVLTEAGVAEALQLRAAFVAEIERKERFLKITGNWVYDRMAESIRRLVRRIDKEVEYSRNNLDRIRKENANTRIRRKEWQEKFLSCLRTGNVMDAVELMHEKFGI